MGRIIFLTAIVSILAFTKKDTVVKNVLVNVTSESTLLIRGTSNVSTFTCSFNIIKIKNPISVIFHIEDGKMRFNKTALVLDNDCFDCGGKGINNDFQKLLKSDKYSQIFLILKEISYLENELDVQALIDIEITGVTKSYEIPIKVKKNNGILITGNLDISLIDYGLEPPKKLFGLISVNDKVEIYFQLAIDEC